MRIVHIITGLGLGGAESVLYRIVRKTAKQNVVTVVSLTDGGLYAKRMQECGAEVRELGMKKGRLILRAVIELYRILRSQRPDIVQTWMYHADLIGGVVARAAGVKVVVWGIRNMRLDSRQTSVTTRFVAKLCAVLSKWVPSAIISCSKAAADVHRRLGYVAKKIVVVPNGVDLHMFAPNEKGGQSLRAKLQIEKDMFLIGMVSRFDPLKDHANLIGAINSLRQSGLSFVCILVGSGMTEDNRRLRDMVSEARVEDSVRFLGPREDIPDVMNALDLHVLSSVGEAFPNVLAEAMACGTPCVSTDAGDSDLIIGNTGWIVPAENSQILADAIAAACRESANNEKEWLQRREMCRERIVDRFGLDKMVESYQNVWDRAATKSLNGVAP